MDFGVMLIIIGTVVVLYGAGMLRTAGGGGNDPVSMVREAMAANKEQGIPTASMYARNGDQELRYEAAPQAARNPLEDLLNEFGAGTGPGNGHPG